MTNVRYLRRTTHLPASPSTVSGQEQRAGNRSGPLRPGLAVVSLLALVIMFASDAAMAADEAFTFGRTSIGTAPSGAAGGTIIDSNRNGLGFSARAGHEAGGTVGRNESVSLFGLSPYVNIGNGLLFGDSRLTYANNGGLAWSFGGGYRHYITAWDAVVGGYGYVDRDQITGASFRQWSVGGEILADDWESRFNWYQPTGNTSTQTGTRIDPGSAVFEESRVLFDRINTFAEALQGFDAEVGFRLPGKCSERFDIRAFGGGYQYEGAGLPAFTGFSTRLQADVGDWLELGLKLTDDEVFHTNVTFGAIVHFGGFHSQEHTSRCAMQRLAEPVRRNLNIASAVSDVTVGGEVARAADGTELTIIHVNSNAPAGGTGTVEMPFNSLATGLAVPGADVVFTHAGSIFDLPPDNLVVLEADQNLFGEGLIADPSGNRVVVNVVQLAGIGDLTLPASPTFQSNMTLSRPILSNSAGPAVTLGDESRFGGFVIDASGSEGILADSVSNVVIRDTLITDAARDGILLTNVLNSATILDTQIIDAAGAAFHVDGGSALIGFSSTSIGIDPAYGSIVNRANESVLIENTTGGSVNMTGSTIGDPTDQTISGGSGIVIRNSAGNAIIDNASILDSPGTGISITDSSGSYFFRDTIRDSTRIENAVGASVLVSDLAESGRVSFENLDIVTPQGGGIDINRLAGQFNFTQDLAIGTAAAGSVAPFISVDSSLATGMVTFGGDIAITAVPAVTPPTESGGRGIELINNVAGSSFTASGQTTIISVGGEGIAIADDDSTIIFGSLTTGGVTVQESGLEAVSIMNADGAVLFRNNANLIQNTNAGNPLLNIRSSEGPIQFDFLQVLAGTTDTGVHIQDNITGANGPGSVVIDTLGIVTTGGVGLFGTNNTLIRTQTGNIDATNAPAVDISNSGIDINLEQVTSINSPTFGIQLVETNKDLSNHPIVAKNFTVQGDAARNPTALSGGQILAATDEGVRLENAGQVSLRAMEIRDNLYGIRVFNSGITTEDDQLLELFGDSIAENDIRGLESFNLTELDIRDSLFDDNGDTAGGRRETMFLEYNERANDPTTTDFDEYDNPYLVNVQRTQFIDNTDDVITIGNTATAIGAHIGINIEQNQFLLNDTNDFDVTDLNEAAFEITWDGPARIVLEANLFELAGTNGAESQTAMFLDMNSTTDLLELEIIGNVINNTSQPGAFGIDMSTSGPSNSLIDSNAFNFSGLDSQGMRFTLGPETVLNLTNNLLRFEAEGGFGIEVERLVQPAVFQISGNTIQLTDTIGNFFLPNDGPLEEGIFFRSASGAYTIFGGQNNIIELISFGDIDRFAVFNGNVNGQIIVNGISGP